MSKSFKSSNNLTLIKKKKENMRLNMLEVIIEDLTDKEEDNSKLKRNPTEPPLEKSIDIDYMIDLLNLDIVKILKYNRI